jgi:competence protein ComEC
VQNPYTVPLWKKAPFIRLLVPLATAILLQWYFQFLFPAIITAGVCFAITYVLFLFFPIATRYRLQFLQGSILNLLLICLGLAITLQKDIRNNHNWFGSIYRPGDLIVVRVNEPLVEKAKSFKVEGIVEAVIRNNGVINCSGKILMYFSKDSLNGSVALLQNRLQYGDKILFNKNLQRIKNSGNPGAFNYERYAAFQQIFHQVFLKENDWVKTGDKNLNSFKQSIFRARENIISILKDKIPAGKDELGIAEALLIGYTNDLDKDLVQAYSNTGVVHIIAISGMHLGLIYVLLVWLFKKIPVINQSKTLQVVLILCCLWMFSFLTGAAASILRSAVMFTFIAIGKNISKQASIFNSLTASAFVMLCYNPYFLWDVGFQLSYLAVIGIVIFQRPIYNWFYIKNRWLNEIWKLVAISLAAQLLTFPVCIYYFHQFPNFFLFTNIIAVPLSSMILFAEIGLVAFYHVPYTADYLGKIVGGMLWAMNKFIVLISQIPYAVWDHISASLASTFLLYAMIIGLCTWLFSKNNKSFRLAVICFFCFTLLQAYASWQIKNQQKIIVYNIAQHQAIDFVVGNKYYFLGDPILLVGGILQNFHLKPARISLQLNNNVGMMADLYCRQPFYQLGNTKVMVIDKAIQFEQVQQKMDVDVIIISKNPKLHIAQLASVFNCKHYVFDAANSLWKIVQWQKEANELHLNSYSVSAMGAFVYDIGM